jgi:hypothetical protein
MRRVLLVCAAITFALACTDNITEPTPDRSPATVGATASRAPTVAFATTTTEDGLSISTDKDDYQPGDVVHLTGYGWQADDVLDIVLTDDPLTHDPHTWSVRVEGDGTFQDATYVVDNGDLDVTFTLVATSRETGRSLTVQFTDGRMLVSVQLNGTSSPITVTPGATISATVTVTTFVQSGTGNDNWRGTSWLIGTALGVRACNDHANHDGAGTYTETFAITAPSIPGTYSAFFQAHQGDDCPAGNASTVLTLANFVVVVSPTSTSVSSSENPSTVGTPVSFTATVSTGNPASAVTTGQVSFKTGGTSCADAAPAQAAQNFVSGQVTYTPSPNLALGSHIIRACYGGTSTLAASENSVTQQVNAPSSAAPVLDVIGNKTVNELQALTFTATANDAAGQTLTFSLDPGTAGAIPAGATINSSTGAFTWTPTELQGPGTYTFDVCVADNGTPSLSDCETITVAVNEVNLPPELGAIGAKNIDEEVALTFTATATDPDLPANTLSFSLQDGTNSVPAGAAINALTGAFSWTPDEDQGPGEFKFKVRVTDGTGPAALFDEEEITVTVKEVNREPVLGTIGNKTVAEVSPLSFTATATDPDRPANTLTFSLDGAPAGASVSSAGAFTWTPGDNTVATFKVIVTDNGSPQMADEETITVTVNNVPPTITSITATPSGQLVLGSNNQATTTVTVAFTDPAGSLDEPYTTTITCGNGTNASSAGVCTYAAADVGGRTISSTVTDKDGGVSDPKTVQVQVIYNWTGFFQPVDNVNLNVAKAGSAIPVKFNLGGNQGLSIFAAGFPSTSKVVCDSHMDQDSIEETVNAGGSTLTYDVAAGQYVYVWKTDKSWVGTCRRLDVKLIDGTTHSAYFKFK